jgi:hypothetical protein
MGMLISDMHHIGNFVILLGLVRSYLYFIPLHMREEVRGLDIIIMGFLKNMGRF